MSVMNVVLVSEMMNAIYGLLSCWLGVLLKLILTLMLSVRSNLSGFLTTLLAYGYRTPQYPKSFKQRIAKFEKYLDRVDRRF